nr:uncharacterized protein LOC113814756 [Penaeus vannamei]
MKETFAKSNMHIVGGIVPGDRAAFYFKNPNIPRRVGGRGISCTCSLYWVKFAADYDCHWNAKVMRQITDEAHSHSKKLAIASETRSTDPASWLPSNRASESSKSEAKITERLCLLARKALRLGRKEDKRVKASVTDVAEVAPRSKSFPKADCVVTWKDFCFPFDSFSFSVHRYVFELFNIYAYAVYTDCGSCGIVALTTSSALLPHDAAEQQRGLSKILQRSDRGQLVRATALDALREAQEAGERRAGGIASTFVRDGEEGEKDGWPIFYKGNKEKRKDRQASTGNNKNKKQGTKKKKKKKKKRNKKKMMSMKKEIEAKLLPTTSLRKIYWEPEPLRRTWEAEESVDPVRVSCRDDEWACVDGSMCVPKNVTCSGVAECQDNSDEAVALCGCLPNEYNCGDQCIDALSRCDTVQDCDNGRDEHNCETYVCPSTHTKCANSLCIPLDAVCNLEDDCGDGSDEQECRK